jgi:inhibitor of KinA
VNRFRLVPAGDAAVIAEFEERIDPVVNARAVALADAVRAASITGIRDVVPTYRSVAVYFDPLRTDYAALVAWFERQDGAEAGPAPYRPPIRVPVCYGGEFGPDLDAVAALTRMSPDEVVHLHASVTYRVFMLGFVAGFAYMGVLDERLRVPRRTTPRTRVPTGSVGLAGLQTGIYPSDVPGGWQIIGRTPIRPFDEARSEPFLFTPGDSVRFAPIDRHEYDANPASGQTPAQ